MLIKKGEKNSYILDANGDLILTKHNSFIENNPSNFGLKLDFDFFHVFLNSSQYKIKTLWGVVKWLFEKQ